MVAIAQMKFASEARPSQYGISSNTLAVRTPKFILKLLFKTFSASPNTELFHAFEFLILRTYKQEAHGPHRSPELTAVNMYM